jgi:hypothetical protein
MGLCILLWAGPELYIMLYSTWCCTVHNAVMYTLMCCTWCFYVRDDVLYIHDPVPVQGTVLFRISYCTRYCTYFIGWCTVMYMLLYLCTTLFVLAASEQWPLPKSFIYTVHCLYITVHQINERKWRVFFFISQTIVTEWINSPSLVTKETLLLTVCVLRVC